MLNETQKQENEMDRSEIIDRLGADDWAMVKSAYSDMSKRAIKNDLDSMWPHEPDANDELAEEIHSELS